MRAGSFAERSAIKMLLEAKPKVTACLLFNLPRTSYLHNAQLKVWITCLQYDAGLLARFCCYSPWKMQYWQCSNLLFVPVQVFQGNHDRNSEVKHVLVDGVFAKYLRFLPTTHHSSICMRTEVFGVKLEPGRDFCGRPCNLLAIRVNATWNCQLVQGHLLLFRLSSNAFSDFGSVGRKE